MANPLRPAEGTRLRLAEHTGTVKFVGSVENTTGIWLGVEWDDPKRGKHDGVKDGKRYFTCRVPNAGSFIRPTSSISYGTSFLKALYSKYVEMPHGSDSQEKVLLGSSNGAIEVEAVDLDKIRGKFANLDRLREISLDNENVSRYDEPAGTIRATCPSVRGLDLSTSLIPSWDLIALISVELPALQRLSLNRNRLQSPRDQRAMTLAFSHLIELRLNGTLTTWNEMQQITAAMPILRIIEMGYNLIDELSTGDLSQGSTIETINLDSNDLRDWVHIYDSLQPYTSLERVVLTSNKIDKISPPLIGQGLNIKHLSLSFNRLESWGDVDALSAWCPALNTLTLNGNPLFDDAVLGRNSRQMTVARIPTLVALDAATISAKERTDCELFYLSHIALHGSKTEQERNLTYPRWAELCKKHGRPAERDTNHNQDKLSRRLMELNMYHCNAAPPFSNADLQAANANSLIQDAERIILRVLPTMTLRALRLKICKTMKYSASSTALSLWLQMQDGSFTLLEGDRDTQDLAWLGIESGSNIIFCKT
ncbi:Tubulin-specific chaperone E [Mycena venus]|uniref:Tubulin-specific chaperone E n=1 Tax=Mycena venus TaxID=2733690 RepID=A0A8H6XCH8_9AGAR|nr:Tubulin-specific chaperone E [Mycena venus]